MQALSDIAPYLAAAAAALCLVLLVFVLLLWRGVRRLRRAQLVILGRSEERDIVAHVENLDSQVRNQREAVEILTDQLDEHKRRLDRALTNRAILRYDAFRDAGGEQSASFALLDEYRSGVVISAIAARDFARIYVKHLRNGIADRELSPEEQQVVEAAVPRALKAGERGPRAARAPRPDAAAQPSAARPLPASGELTGEPASRPAPTPEGPVTPPSETGVAEAGDVAPPRRPPQAGPPAAGPDTSAEPPAPGRDPADVFDELWPPDHEERRSV